MNLGKIAMDNVSLEMEEKVNTDSFKERESKLTKLIESLREVQQTKAWSSLKKDLFDELPANLERQISAEAKKLNPDILKLNRLSGELKWAERYSNLKKFEDELMVELQNVRKQLN